MTTLPYIDFHAHHPSLAGEWVIQDGVQTRGRHPWHLLTPSPLPAAPDGAQQQLLAIGESGLDRLCATPYPLQLQAFEAEVRKSEQCGLPLILHCVRAIDDVLRIRRSLHARQPILWHAYRGNAVQLRQLLALSGENFYFSFGFRHRPEALRLCPLPRLLLETDEETRRPIAELYALVAAARGIPLPDLLRQMHANYSLLFASPGLSRPRP